VRSLIRLVVPEDAVLVRQGRDLVFVIEEGRAQWTYVNLGARSGDFVEITKGVAPGDTIAVDDRRRRPLRPRPRRAGGRGSGS
jgi:multidrug efflux pump subunit AcrA (membrane-fusion protein)